MHAGTGTTEPPSERVVLGNVVNGLDAERDKFRDLAGMNSGKPQNMVAGKGSIAVVKELAGDWLRAVPSCRNFGSLIHLEDTEL